MQQTAMTPLSEHTAVVIFSHGSRDPLWREPIEAVARMIRLRSPHTPVACAYLELCAPDLADAAMNLIAACAGRIRVLRVFPLFLGQGRHAREDLPILIAQLRAAHPDIQVELMPSAGEFAALTDLLSTLAMGWQPGTGTGTGPGPDTSTASPQNTPNFQTSASTPSLVTP